jgi:hypothetical protein
VSVYLEWHSRSITKIGAVDKESRAVSVYAVVVVPRLYDCGVDVAGVLDLLNSLGESVGGMKKVFDNGGLDTLDNAEFVEVASELEALRRVLATLDYPIVAQVRVRDLSGQHLTRDAGGFLAKVHRVDPGAARGRVREVDHLAARHHDRAAVRDPHRPCPHLLRAAPLRYRDQIDALHARDGGCAFPGYDHPADWCQRHHIRDWANGGPTDIDNLVLLCGYHHRCSVMRLPPPLFCYAATTTANSSVKAGE